MKNLALQFHRREAPRIPEHWLRFGSRSSPISKPSPRRAGNPANALLNYVYAILEAQCRISALAVGLDPAIGVMHLDLKARDSLACDLMEPVRPSADAFVLNLLRSREFRKADFFETREGVCRIFSPITCELINFSTQFSRTILSIAEDVSRKLLVAKGEDFDRQRASESEAVSIQIMENESPPSKGRRLINLRGLKRKYQSLPCLSCGKPIDGHHRSYCDARLKPM